MAKWCLPVSSRGFYSPLNFKHTFCIEGLTCSLRNVCRFLRGHVCTSVGIGVRDIFFWTHVWTSKNSPNWSEVGGGGRTRHGNICGPYWVVLIRNSSGNNNLSTKAKYSYSIFNQSTMCIKGFALELRFGWINTGSVMIVTLLTVLLSVLAFCAWCFIQHFP